MKPFTFWIAALLLLLASSAASEDANRQERIKAYLDKSFTAAATQARSELDRSLKETDSLSFALKRFGHSVEQSMKVRGGGRGGFREGRGSARVGKTSITRKVDANILQVSCCLFSARGMLSGTSTPLVVHVRT